MKDEIKEILNQLKMMKYDENSPEIPLDLISRKAEKTLLDYITNLQEENKFAKKYEKEYREIYKKYKDYKSRNEKAIEIIKFTSNLKYEDEYVGLFINDVCNTLLNIL